MSTFHVIPYAEWASGLRTHCCKQWVTELPKTDHCGSSWALREPDQTRCDRQVGVR
jgi:hypothetical protein